MNAATSTSPTSSLTLSSFFNGRRHRCCQLPPRSLFLLITSSFSRRRHRRRPKPNSSPSPSPSSSDRDINLSIDLDSISDRASSALTRFNSNLRRFIASGADAFDDLRTSIRVDPGRHVVFSCRRSSVLFATDLFVFGVAVFVAVRALAFLGFWRRLGFVDGRAVVRRDRSLGGREVVVARGLRRGENERGGLEKFKGLGNPLADVEGVDRRGRGNLGGKLVAKREETLPEWWPESVSVRPVGSIGNEEFKREADRLVRAILDNRLSGKDYKDDDIIQLRQICKISDARVSFGTDNARDSFYRASVDFVLKMCSRVMQPAPTVQINGEDARQFISGLAGNIGLDNTRAAKIIRAAVAARARSCFLQSWAFEVQGKRFEALEELSKICQIFQIFPPEEYSPEMEMVASGLNKTLGIEQRKHLLALFNGVCGSMCQRIAEEALGPIYTNGYNGSENRRHSENHKLF